MLLRRLSLIALCVASQYAGICLAADETSGRPLDIRLFHSLNRIGGPVVSPNNGHAIFVTTTYNPDSNKSSSYVSLLDIATGNITQLTDSQPGQAASNLLWFDDETIGFMRHGTLYCQQISANAAPLLVYNPPTPISSVSYRANTGLLAFTGKLIRRAEANKTDSGMVFDNLWVRHWNEWMSKEKPRVFVASLSKGPLGWSEFAISPHGDNVAFVTRPPSEDMAWKTDVDIYLVSTTGSTHPRLLTGHVHGMASSPAFSSDGRKLAWLQMETPGYEADINRIYVHDIATRETISIARNWELTPHSLLWSADDTELITMTGKEGTNRLIAVNVATGARRELTKEGSSSSVRLAGPNKILYVHSDNDKCSDIHILDTSSFETKQLTDINEEKLRNVYLSKAEDFWFPGARGDLVHGWLLRPYNFDKRKKYPLAYLVHGGPQQANTHSFSHAQWNPNMYASAGFVTVQINFHGSPTYGQNFTDSIRHNWGNYPYVDLMRGIDYIADKHRFIDTTRMCALGGSFGAYMMNWFNGHTDRFKCLVAHDGKLSTVSGYYGTDELWFPEWDLGKPWEPAGREILEENNPERFASSFRTPTLFIQGEKDFRIPVSESLGGFTLLRRRGIPARLLYFPDEDHWINRNINSIKWYTEVLSWITQWTNTTAPYPIRPNPSPK
ncbi:alpha/beta-hydrolase [Linderina pennispora]|uniref:Dipeptidyl-peptidase V n=1 Tax=Linderina pennispora TaxID=61395 RepID=A0A1Y1WJJ9_9FUNG|nr:alpha/beta-hydrolase [Linderina pennispora]ORX73663.1 alpha/beta-hydrolase [Linderina pennispora]